MRAWCCCFFLLCNQMAAFVVGPKVAKKGRVVLYSKDHVPLDWPGALVGEAEEETLTVGDAAALIGGTTVGAGILALPTALAKAGFLAGVVTLLGSYVFMVAAALLVAETTSTATRELQRPGLSLLSTSTTALGEEVGNVSGLAYVFIHYALLVAYASQGGAVVSNFLGLSENLGVFLFTIFFGGIVVAAPSAIVDGLNNVLVILVILSFGALAYLTSPQINVERLLAMPTDWSAAFAAAPICILALVFHNVIPVVVTRFKGNRRAVSASVLFGSAIPLVLFLIWTFIVLASVDVVENQDAVLALEANGADIATAVNVFRLSAVATSFFGFYYGLRTFFDDIIKDRYQDLLRQKDLIVPLLILLPPLVFAIALGSDVFLAALDAAGTFGITSLFGIIPAATAYTQRSRSNLPIDTYLPGGYLSLAIVFVLAATVFAEGLIDFLPPLKSLR